MCDYAPTQCKIDLRPKKIYLASITDDGSPMDDEAYSHWAEWKFGGSAVGGTAGLVTYVATIAVGPLSAGPVLPAIVGTIVAGGAGPLGVAAAVGAALVVGGVELLENAHEKSWELQDPCTDWCREQAQRIPFLDFVKNPQTGEKVRVAPHNFREQPYNMVNRGMVIGKGLTCNADIGGSSWITSTKKYCSQGCTINGTPMPCTIVRTHGQGETSPKPGFMFDENGATTTTTPILDNTGSGPQCIGETEKFCCCVDPAVRDALQKTKDLIDSN